MEIGLYIHEPFCLSKCPYCNFYSVTYEKDIAKRYNKKIMSCIESFLNERGGTNFDTVYFGGGTPSLCFTHVAKIMRRLNGMGCHIQEATMECNPGDADEYMLKTLRGAGVNRISFGVQSFSDSALRKLGRRHTAAQAENAVRMAHNAGFYNISVDLMFGLSRETEARERGLSFIARMPVTHVSLYMLKIEKGTPFYEQNLKLPDEDTICDMYLQICKDLNDLGFGQYEISNFAKPSFECAHNMKYWRGGAYLGIGASAHSYTGINSSGGGVRYCTPASVRKFLDGDLNENMIVTDSDVDVLSEYIMLGLRLCEGVSFAKVSEYGGDLDLFMNELQRIPADMYVLTETGVRLTPKGFLVSNEIIARLEY